MLKVLRLSSVFNRISILQLTKFIQQTTTNGKTTMASNAADNNLEGIVKFLEIVGNLKVKNEDASLGEGYNKSLLHTFLHFIRFFFCDDLSRAFHF